MAIINDHVEETLDERTNILPPQGPRVRWAGVMSGFFVAIGVLMLMGALGLAIGVTALGDPRAATGDTASGLGIGAGVWAFITMLVALFLGGMVSTKVTDRPDRPGALIHGVLVWVLLSLFTVWMIASGVSLGLSGLFGALSELTRGATTAVAAGGGDLVQTLGLNDPNQVMNKLDDPATASTLAAATGMSTEEARAALGDLRARVQAVRDDPARVAAEVREFLAQYAERAKQQALVAAAKAQRGAKIGSWVMFGAMVVGVGVSIAGAMGGVPSFRRWRRRVGEVEPTGAVPAWDVRGIDTYDADFRRHYTTSLASRGHPYERWSPGYRYGYELASDQRYAGRDWTVIEPEARRDWEARHQGTWEEFKDTIRYAWDTVRGRH
jgi:hypothetical protein